MTPPATRTPAAVEVRGVSGIRLGPFTFGHSTVLLLLGAIVGLVVGGVAIVYREIVHLGNSLLLEHGPIPLEGTWLVRLLFPAAGGLLVGFLLKRYYARPAAHGVPSVIRAVQRNRVLFPWNMLYPSAASVVILTSGGSAGPEGPVAEIGSVFGAKIGRLFHVHRRMYRTLVAAGVAAGISAIFDSPFGGVFFALEVILQEFELVSFAPVVIASVVASVVSAAAAGQLGLDPAFTVRELHVSNGEIPFFALLGVVTGLLSIAFITFLNFAGRQFQRVPLPRWLHPALGGLMVGFIGLELGRVMGEGYFFINIALLGKYGWTMLLALLIGKFVATGITLGSGAPGGSFAPALFVGAMAGCLLGTGLEAVAPNYVGGPGSYGLVGMAGMIAGAFNAPMTAIMIIFRRAEGDYSILLPLMTTVAVSTAVMSHWGNVSLYTSILRKQGEWAPPGAARDPLYGLVVGDILTTSVATLPAHLSVARAMERISNLDETTFVVQDEAEQFLGLVSLSDLRLALADPMMGQLISLADVIDPDLPWLEPKSTISGAIRVFAGSRREALPVFEDSVSHGFLGLVTRSTVIDAYRDSRIESRDDT